MARYNDGGLADSFWNGYERTSEGIQKVQRDRGLAQIENEQPTESTTGAIAPGLGDVGQNDDKAYGAMDSIAGIDQGTAVDRSPGSPGLKQFSVQGQVADTPDDARRAARASLMRRTGAPADANKEEEAGNVINQGRSTAKIAGFKARAAARDDSNDSATFEVQQEMAKYAQDHQIDATTPSGASDLAARHVQALVSRGLTAEAEKVSKAYTNVLINQIKGTEVQRGEAAVGVEQALQTGNPAAMKAALQKLDALLPNGGRVEDVQPGPKPGTFIVTRTEGDGSKSQKMVDADMVRQMTDMTTGTQFDKISQSMVKSRLDIKHVEAQIKASNASANSSNAAAAEHSARTDVVRDSLAQTQKLNKILAKSPEERTPEEDAFIEGEHERSQLASERRARGAGGGSGNAKLTFKINPDGSTTVAKPDGSLWTKGRKDTQFSEVTPGGPVKGATAPTRAEVEDAKGGGGQPAPAGVASPSALPPGTIPPPAQRVVGQIYKNAAGTAAKWTGSGWEPQ